MKVYLGDFIFDPGPRRQIAFSNPRKIATIDIPGASPRYQDMGPGETTISWDGVLQGEGAYDNAVKVESMKDSGKEFRLVAGKLVKTVRIRKFDWFPVRDDYVSYNIELVMVVPRTAQLNTRVVGQTKVQAVATAKSVQQLANKVITVRQGDTLWKLSQKYLGDGSHWRTLARVNGITDLRKFVPGMKLKVPDSANADTLVQTEKEYRSVRYTKLVEHIKPAKMGYGDFRAIAGG